MNLGRLQQAHWQSVYEANPHMYGEEPSAPARHAAERFTADCAGVVLELGAGHGRDSLHFARAGFRVHATDFSAAALSQLSSRAQRDGLADRVEVITHDVRTRLPLPDQSVDAAFAHMLVCMVLSTQEIHDLFTEVRRILRPGGRFIYTVRHTGDAHFGTGSNYGDGIYEQGGFAVHFFDRPLVDSLAKGWTLNEVHPFEEGDLPRKLWRIDQVKVRENSKKLDGVQRSTYRVLPPIWANGESSCSAGCHVSRTRATMQDRADGAVFDAGLMARLAGRRTRPVVLNQVLQLRVEA